MIFVVSSVLQPTLPFSALLCISLSGCHGNIVLNSGSQILSGVSGSLQRERNQCSTCNISMESILFRKSSSLAYLLLRINIETKEISLIDYFDHILHNVVIERLLLSRLRKIDLIVWCLFQKGRSAKELFWQKETTNIYLRHHLAPLV